MDGKKTSQLLMRIVVQMNNVRRIAVKELFGFFSSLTTFIFFGVLLSVTLFIFF